MNRRDKKRIDLALERGLIGLYSEMFSRLPIGLSANGSRRHLKSVIEQCKKQAQEQGTADLPDNYGDIILHLAKEGELKAKAIVEKAISEGATEYDIREYWNLSDLERRMANWSEHVFRYSTFISFHKDQGFSSNEAMGRIRKMFPMYGNPVFGNPDDTSQVSGEDRPLPRELRGRIDAYRELHRAASIQEKVFKYSTFNAFVRDMIKKENL
ncbi:hypothetical protein ACFLR7_03110 [Acidobacteriota bacterium]